MLSSAVCIYMINYTYTHKCVSPNTWESTVRKSMMLDWDLDTRKQELRWMAWAGPTGWARGRASWSSRASQVCHCSLDRASKCFVYRCLKEGEEGRKVGRGLWVRIVALTMCQSLDLPSGPNVAERQVLLRKALHPHGHCTGGDRPCAVKRKCRHVLGDNLEQVSSKRDVSLNS